jgi:hypothetical protein
MTAGFRAPVARRGAALHNIISAGEPLAFLGASVANLRTNPAYLFVMMRRAKHEVGTGLADLSAIVEQPLVLRRCVFPAHRQTVSGGFDTKRMAIEAVRDTLPHVRCEVMLVHGFVLLLLMLVFRFRAAQCYIRNCVCCASSVVGGLFCSPRDETHRVRSDYG